MHSLKKWRCCFLDQTQYNTKINGCDIGSYSRMAKKCRNCDKREYCDHKKIEKLAHIIPNETTIGIDLAGGKDFSANAAGAVGWTVTEAAEALNKAMRAAAVQMETPNEIRRLCNVDTTNKG